MENNLYNIYIELCNKYKVGKYNEFTITDPKERIILSLPFKDRIIHQWYIEEFIKPYYVKRFIYDSYACIKNKGSHKGINRLKYFLNKIDYNNAYVIKFDIKKYFNSINKDILFNIIKHNIKDKKVLEITKIIIFENSYFNGIPIGNYTSQYFANIYLNELDYYIKNYLKIKYYIRYMDDFIIIVDSKIKAKEIFNNVKIFLKDKLELELNNKSRYYRINKGIDFCGYKVYKDYILIRRRCKKKIIKKIKLWNRLYKINRLKYKKFLLSYNSFLGHISHGDCFKFKEKVESLIFFLNN